ncbi:MAG: hypothetical protein KAW46_01820, partial [candidate division Zixibacteria bacterium]|nr:hypothetical protein [candidate division Zixibacteria bacterium]
MRTKIIVAALVLITPLTITGQSPDIVIDVGDVTACSGQQNVAIPIYLSNYYDTVVGFNLWVQLDRPDIMLFEMCLDSVVDTTRWQCLLWDGEVCLDSIHVTGDTTYWRCDVWSGDICTDSTMVPPDSTWDFFHLAEWDFINVDTNEVLVGSVDTAGTLISGWEWVDSRSLSGYGWDLNIAGIADLPGDPVTPGIGPQEGGLLINMIADVNDIPDTLTDSTVNILVMTQFAQHFCFSNPQGECIGDSNMVVTLDTTLLRCTLWAEEVCLHWQVVAEPPFDSMIVQWDTTFVSTVVVYNGSLTVVPTLVGDIDDSGSLPMDIADLVYLVDWMFAGGSPPICPQSADCDGDSTVDIADLVCW